MKILFRTVQCLVIWWLFASLFPVYAQCGGFVTGKAINLPKPIYPENIKISAPEKVVIQTEINESGYVIKTKKILGRSDFAEISEKAALASRFSTSYPSVRITGLLTYTFLTDKLITVSDSLNVTKEVLERVNKACQRENYIYSLRFKADDAIVRVVARLLRNQNEPAFDESAFVTEGKAEIGIRLKRLNNKVLVKLKAFGLTITGKIIAGNAVTGQIPIENLKNLLDFSETVYVFPFWAKSPPKVSV